MGYLQTVNMNVSLVSTNESGQTEEEASMKRYVTAIFQGCIQIFFFFLWGVGLLRKNLGGGTPQNSPVLTHF